jgi:CRP/FNR family cyclic AMP-dependent transcriptional regulator
MDPSRVGDHLTPRPGVGSEPSSRKLRTETEVEQLAALPLFASCSKRELRHFARSTRVELHAAGQKLFEEGQPSREAYVIVAGHAVVHRNGTKIAELGPGEFFGELGVLLHREHSETVTATSPLEVLVLSQSALRDALDELPGLGWKLLQTVAARMSDNATARGGAPE